MRNQVPKNDPSSPDAIPSMVVDWHDDPSLHGRLHELRDFLESNNQRFGLKNEASEDEDDDNVGER